MRKLPDNCPTEAHWSPMWGLLVGGTLAKDMTVVEVAPAGSRALLDEALKMVERFRALDQAWDHKGFSDACLDAAALLAKAREGEGTSRQGPPPDPDIPYSEIDFLF